MKKACYDLQVVILAARGALLSTVKSQVSIEGTNYRTRPTQDVV